MTIALQQVELHGGPGDGSLQSVTALVDGGRVELPHSLTVRAGAERHLYVRNGDRYEHRGQIIETLGIPS